MGRRFVAVLKGLVGDEDYLSAAFFGFFPDGFFCGRDEGGDQYAAVGRCVEPSFTVLCFFSLAVPAMDNDLLFEWVAKQKLVAIGLVTLAADGDSIDAPEKVRIGPADGEAVGV